MSKIQTATVADAVHKLQLALLDGVQDEAQLFAAGSLMSRSDYEDVVMERSIANACGYPLCPNALPSERSRKGHYRIALKEHKVYDLHETYMYCSSACLINSRAFAGSLQDERCMVMNPAKLNDILRMFKNLGVETEEEVDKSADQLSKLKIQEKTDIKGGEVAVDDWIGPSHAIEGYVPQRDRKLKAAASKTLKKGSEAGTAKLRKHGDTVQKEGNLNVAVTLNGDTNSPRKVQEKKKYSGGQHSTTSKPLVGDMDFMSCIITNDEYTVSKNSDGEPKPDKSNVANKGSKPRRSASKKSDGDPKPGKSNVAKVSKPKGSSSKKRRDSILNAAEFKTTIITQDEYSSSKFPSLEGIPDPNQISSNCIEKLYLVDSGKQIKPSEQATVPAWNGTESSTDSTAIETRIITNENLGPAGDAEVSYCYENDAGSSSVHVQDESSAGPAIESSKTRGRSSLKTSGTKKAARSVTWADEKKNGLDSGSLYEVKEFKTTERARTLGGIQASNNDDYQRFDSAQACAMALSQAAAAVASGESDVTDAVSEAGITVLPQQDEIDEEGGPLEDEGELSVEDDGSEDTVPLKWPRKPGNIDSDVLESGDSWFDGAPEGFSLTLSPFATMWNALFSWMTSSSLAFIYGRDESCHEEYLFVNGREYPSKVVLPDGRSSEIKQTLAGCLARALPGVIAALKLPTPVSTLEQGLACFLETVSFMEALPPFRLKQWQVIVLLFIDALSVCRTPGLTPHLTSRRILIPKVLEGAQITAEEYEIMKDLVIPLGRVPQFSMQSGG